MTEIQNRPLGLVMQMIEELGSEVTYAYEDLVFINHNAFIVQFTSDPTKLNIYFNKEFGQDKIKMLGEGLKKQAPKNGFEVSFRGSYELAQQEGENIEIKFFQEKPSLD
jgi:hypothetical protein